MKIYCLQLKGREADAIKTDRQTRFLRTLSATPPYGTTTYQRNLSAQTFTPTDGRIDLGPAIKCPYGQIDDLLWGKYVVGQDEQQKPLRNTRTDTDIWLKVTGVYLYPLSLASSVECSAQGIDHYRQDGIYCLPIGSGVGSFKTADPAIAVKVRHELTNDLDADKDPFVWIIDVVRTEAPRAED